MFLIVFVALASDLIKKFRKNIFNGKNRDFSVLSFAPFRFWVNSCSLEIKYSSDTSLLLSEYFFQTFDSWRFGTVLFCFVSCFFPKTKAIGQSYDREISDPIWFSAIKLLALTWSPLLFACVVFFFRKLRSVGVPRLSFWPLSHFFSLKLTIMLL